MAPPPFDSALRYRAQSNTPSRFDEAQSLRFLQSLPSHSLQQVFGHSSHRVSDHPNQRSEERFRPQIRLGWFENHLQISFYKLPLARHPTNSSPNSILAPVTLHLAEFSRAAHQFAIEKILDPLLEYPEASAEYPAVAR